MKHKIKTDYQYICVNIPMLQYRQLFSFDFNENLLHTENMREFQEIIKDKKNNPKWVALKNMLYDIIFNMWSGPDEPIDKETIINDMEILFYGPCIYCEK